MVETSYENNTVRSSSLEINMGAPQGFILGPFLFILYVDDLQDNLTNDANCTLYTDDTSLIISDKNDILELGDNKVVKNASD